MNDQPPGTAARPRHRGKYARAERERRFLLAEPPDTAEFLFRPRLPDLHPATPLHPRGHHRPRFTGGQLAHASRQELLAWLDDYNLTLG